MKKKLPQARVFALEGYTIKSDRGKFFVSPTGRNDWAGPHRSLHHVATAIARRLSREFTQRNERLQQLKEQRP